MGAEKVAQGLFLSLNRRFGPPLSSPLCPSIYSSLSHVRTRMPSVTWSQFPVEQSKSLRRSPDSSHRHTRVHPSCSCVTFCLVLPPRTAKGESGWAAKAASCLTNNQPSVQRTPNLTSSSSPPSPRSPPSGLESGFLLFFLPWLPAALPLPLQLPLPVPKGPFPVQWICYLSAPPAAHSGLHHRPFSIFRGPWACLLITLCPSSTCIWKARMKTQRVQAFPFSPASFYKTRKW